MCSLCHALATLLQPQAFTADGELVGIDVGVAISQVTAANGNKSMALSMTAQVRGL
jgi:hypothetical protein